MNVPSRRSPVRSCVSTQRRRERDVGDRVRRQDPRRKSGILIIGGGSPKNFVLQTEPQIQEVLGISEKGHDYYLQMTDARVDTGGLSGATPAEAVELGKVDPDKLPARWCATRQHRRLPILAAYALAKRKKAPAQAVVRSARAD